jgi:monofunctional biosynthetic peptidoglycan transglycosylase
MARKGKAPPRRTLMNRIAGATRAVLRWTLLAFSGAALLLVAWVLLYRFVDPPGGLYQWSESRRLGGVQREWVDLADVAPVMARSVVAAEDVNFCRHWGFDIEAIRLAIAEGGTRGASTLTQQVVKNVFLWHGRSWVRKALEAALTPVVELLWPKARIVEVYLNIAEFDEGVFGVQAAARHHFDTTAAELTARQASRLAAVLPAPQSRNAARPDERTGARARAIADGAATIANDDRGACFGS